MDKKYNNLTFNDLQWLVKNSYIDYWQYYGKLLQLNYQYKDSKYLVQLFPNIREIERIANNLTLDNYHLVRENILLLFLEFSKNIDLLFGDVKNINEIINLYLLLYKVELFVEANFNNWETIRIYRTYKKSKFVFTKKELRKQLFDIKMIHHKKNIKCNELVGKLNIVNAFYHFGNGEYSKGLKILTSLEDENTRGSYKFFSVYYYIVLMSYLYGDKKHIIELYKKHHENINFANIDKYRESIIYLILYKIGYLSKNIALDKIKQVFYNYHKIEFKLTNQYLYEPLMNYVVIKKFIENKDDLFYDKEI